MLHGEKGGMGQLVWEINVELLIRDGVLKGLRNSTVKNSSLNSV